MLDFDDEFRTVPVPPLQATFYLNKYCLRAAIGFSDTPTLRLLLVAADPGTTFYPAALTRFQLPVRMVSRPAVGT